MDTTLFFYWIISQQENYKVLGHWHFNIFYYEFFPIFKRIWAGSLLQYDCRFALSKLWLLLNKHLADT